MPHHGWPGGRHPLPDLRRGFAGPFSGDFPERHGRYFDVQIDPSQQRARDASEIILDLARRTPELVRHLRSGVGFVAGRRLREKNAKLPPGSSDNSLGIMSGNQQYLDRVKRAVERIHRCSAAHASTVFVYEQVAGLGWQGDVEVFNLIGHPYAQKCYAWSDGQEEGREIFLAVLQSPPITTAKLAIKASLEKKAA